MKGRPAPNMNMGQCPCKITIEQILASFFPARFYRLKSMRHTYQTRISISSTAILLVLFSMLIYGLVVLSGCIGAAATDWMPLSTAFVVGVLATVVKIWVPELNLVLVNGVPVVAAGKLVLDAAPDQPLRRPGK